MGSNPILPTHGRGSPVRLLGTSRPRHPSEDDGVWSLCDDNNGRLIPVNEIKGRFEGLYVISPDAAAGYTATVIYGMPSLVRAKPL